MGIDKDGITSSHHPSKAPVILKVFFVVNHCDKLKFGKKY